MANLGLEEAKARAQELLDASADPSLPLAIGPEPLESAHFWVFFFDTVEFWETGDSLTALAGNAPIVVPKDGSDIGRLTTARSPETQLEELEAAFV